jgi:DNA repair protein RadA/Sms
MVDTVLYFEGDTHSSFRLVRAIKNRFGAVNEIGVFAMTERGLQGVSNPSAIFLSQHSEPVPGSCVLVTLEGTRPCWWKSRRWSMVAALAPAPVGGAGARPPGHVAGGAAPPCRRGLWRPGRVRQRRGRGAHQRAGGRSGGDAGHHLQPARRALPKGFIAFGEVGLAGEVRPAPRGQERLREAAKLGFTVAVMPKANAPRQPIEGLEIHAVERIEEAMSVVRGLG